MDLPGTPSQRRSAQARQIAQSPSFEEADQLAWASAPVEGAALPADLADLTHALIDSVERHACPEFIHALLMAGADPAARADDGSPLWRHALRMDASRPSHEHSAWMLLAALAFGRGFPSEQGSREVRRACEECVAELESLFAAQDEHFKQDPGARATGELYSILNARHDSAMAIALAGAAKAGQERRARRGPRAE